MPGDAAFGAKPISDRSLPVRRVSFCLDFPDAVRPGGADVGQDVPDLFIAHDVAEAGHAALDPGAPPGLHKGLAAEFGVVEEESVVVMPGMAGRVMRRGGQDPVRSDAPPIGLTLEFGVNRRPNLTPYRRAILTP